MRGVQCPYCKKEVEVCHDDGQGYQEDVAHQQECSLCDKRFVFYTTIVHYYEAHEAPCLNGEGHDWTPIVSTLKGRERCSYCDEERIADKALYEKSFRGEA
jgi:uncharacterized Zn-finger protein